MKVQDFLLFRLTMGHARERRHGCLRNFGLSPGKLGHILGLVTALMVLSPVGEGEAQCLEADVSGESPGKWAPSASDSLSVLLFLPEGAPLSPPPFFYCGKVHIT